MSQVCFKPPGGCKTRSGCLTAHKLQLTRLAGIPLAQGTPSLYRHHICSLIGNTSGLQALHTSPCPLLKYQASSSTRDQANPYSCVKTQLNCHFCGPFPSTHHTPCQKVPSCSLCCVCVGLEAIHLSLTGQNRSNSPLGTCLFTLQSKGMFVEKQFFFKAPGTV